MKIWFKIVKDDKLIKDILFENDQKNNKINFERSIRDICYTLDIASPLIINIHFKHFSEFNITKFLASDFLEPVDFDYATAENIYNKKS